ncbi:MAG TPA: M1 family metallopeptidase [Saprospiraceae bacterium]|nr:M1 family metallopeptidase [Saprospiraceae bacterium]HMP25416.1 M1 family metallopeptidase [Saprospiraceae bacterium]
MKRLYFLLILLFGGFAMQAQQPEIDRFSQLETLLPTPNSFRTASGAPGHEYWQQRADYNIKVELDDANQRIIGEETITYYNNSPNPLTYLWLQLDQNIEAPESDTYKTQTGQFNDRMTMGQVNAMFDNSFDGGHKIQYVRDAAGKPLKYTIVNTMMRVDLPQPLPPKTGKISFSIGWNYNIANRLTPTIRNGRGGYEYFPEDDNYLYTITQWFPRMAVYDDYNGWQHKQFLGSGEFTLPFGNYTVAITAPSDHVIASTGVLQNPKDVLTAEQIKRFEQAKTATKPLVIITEAEARENERKPKATTQKTWVYKADNVRDFAFGSSRKYIWDAMGVKIEGSSQPVIMAMSYYPKEANPVYGTYSTEAVAHTLRVYSKYSIPYPYPVAISVEASNGMEYPMICFNYGRPEKDGTYSDRIKYGAIGVIIHEVGHNFFPMIVNSDERQWTWMDEGLNSFVQFLAEQEWERNYPFRRGPARNIVDYMKADKSVQNPIMTNSESVVQLGNNAYGKPATALNILRETIMGRELFDYAFKEYARRWAFKHPTPADFFRTMEDASGVDLDWFWRGWFYTTDAVDIAIDNVTEYRLDTKDPDVEKPLLAEKARQAYESDITNQRNRQDLPVVLVESNEDLQDFYNSYDPNKVTRTDRENYQRYLASLDEQERAFLQKKQYFYQIDFSNVGGLVMPIILEFELEDGSKELRRIPAEVWRRNNYKVSKPFAFDKPLKQVVLDPYQETADIDTDNNYFPRQAQPNRFELFKSRFGGARGQSFGENPMQQQQREERPQGGGRE